jgi:hypothetical protein
MWVGPTEEPSELFEGLHGAIIAAEAAIQTTVALWRHLSPAQQDGWLAEAQTRWPRADIFLKTLLPAAENIIADESTAEGLN